MPMNPNQYDDREMRIAVAGALEASARIYTTSIAVVTRSEGIKALCKQRWGGTSYPDRWILRSREGRLRMLKDWKGYSLWRKPEIDAERARLYEEARDQ